MFLISFLKFRGRGSECMTFCAFSFCPSLCAIEPSSCILIANKFFFVFVWKVSFILCLVLGTEGWTQEWWSGFFSYVPVSFQPMAIPLGWLYWCVSVLFFPFCINLDKLGPADNNTKAMNDTALNLRSHIDQDLSPESFRFLPLGGHQKG